VSAQSAGGGRVIDKLRGLRPGQVSWSPDRSLWRAPLVAEELAAVLVQMRARPGGHAGRRSASPHAAQPP
jgi:hypothetical protein